MIRRFRPEDAQACRDVFVAAVTRGAAGRYTAAERAAWLKDPAMPPGYGEWLGRHITLVAETRGRITGFMMLEASGYLNMAFVLPEEMGRGLADALYQALLAEARALGLRHLQVLASRYAQGFFARRGWRLAPDLVLPGLDPAQGPGAQTLNRAMVIDLPRAPAGQHLP